MEVRVKVLGDRNYNVEFCDGSNVLKSLNCTKFDFRNFDFPHAFGGDRHVYGASYSSRPTIGTFGKIEIGVLCLYDGESALIVNIPPLQQIAMDPAPPGVFTVPASMIQFFQDERKVILSSNILRFKSAVESFVPLVNSTLVEVKRQRKEEKQYKKEDEDIKMVRNLVGLAVYAHDLYEPAAADVA